MSNEEMLKKILLNTENLKEDVDVLKEDMLILKEDNKRLNRKFELLNEKFEVLDEKVEVIDKKNEGLEGKYKELNETVNSINRVVMKMENEYGPKIDIIYENTVSFMNANYRNRDDIEKLEKRVERLECKVL